jgi:RNA polymerase sigma-70 factor (ECF subfamily)
MSLEPDTMTGSPISDRSDEDLIEDYNGGNAGALDILVERYKKPLHGFVLRMTKCHAEADEVFQETWIRVMTKSQGFRKGSFKGWLFRIAHNLVIDWNRRDWKQVSMDAPLGGYGDEATLRDRLQSPDEGPAHRAGNRDVGKAIEQALARLPDEQREVFMLRMEADMAFKDIAKLQGVSLNTALSRMQYALAKLRTLLGDHQLEMEK